MIHVPKGTSLSIICMKTLTAGLGVEQAKIGRYSLPITCGTIAVSPGCHSFSVVSFVPQASLRVQRALRNRQDGGGTTVSQAARLLSEERKNA